MEKKAWKWLRDSAIQSLKKFAAQIDFETRKYFVAASLSMLVAEEGHSGVENMWKNLYYGQEMASR